MHINSECLPQLLSNFSFSFIFETELYLAQDLLSGFSQFGWPVSSREPPVSSPALTLQSNTTTLGFFSKGIKFSSSIK